MEIDDRPEWRTPSAFAFFTTRIGGTLGEAWARLGTHRSRTYLAAVILVSRGGGELNTTLLDDGFLMPAELDYLGALLRSWAEDLPPVDLPDDEDEQPATTDDEYIRRAVDQEQGAAEIANAITRAYDEQAPEGKQLGAVDFPPETDAATEAVLEIENWRSACRAALDAVNRLVGRD